MINTIMDKVITIFERSELSISKFAKIIGKDRRTVSSWVNKEVSLDPKKDVQEKISQFFRYPDDIWEDECVDNEFLKLINAVPTKYIKIFEDNRENRLKYILKKEAEQRLVIHPRFPGSIYRDAIGIKRFEERESESLKKLKKQRVDKMLSYSYKSDEWYDIKSLLSFCFSQIGIFYTKEEKVAILDLMYDTFHDNYNKHLFLFDSFSKKIYGLDTMYTSVMILDGTMFFKSPLESVFIEVTDKEIVEKIHKYFTSGKEAPSHIKPHDATKVLKILRDAIAFDQNLFEAYKVINETTKYGELIKNNISISHLDKIY